jgi:Protein phosphatase 2C
MVRLGSRGRLPTWFGDGRLLALALVSANYAEYCTLNEGLNYMPSNATTPSSARQWACHVCHHGLLLAPVEAAATIEAWQQERQVLIARNLPEDMCLLGGADHDELVRLPPLAELLSEEDVTGLWHVDGLPATAATYFGPSDQDKLSNQDFALAGRIACKNHGDLTFVAVADGVSQRTFWPERASRLACMVAYKTLRRMLAGQGADNLQFLRSWLVQDLRATLERERDVLLAADVVPPGWDEPLYRRLMHRRELWFNSTLLIAFLGLNSGGLVYAGDGGISVLRTDRMGNTEEKRPLISVENMTIETSVSMEVTEHDFMVGSLSDVPGAVRTEILLASDGVDRTLQRQDGTGTVSSYATLARGSAMDTFHELQVLAECPGREFDNFSIARITRFGPMALTDEIQHEATLPGETNPDTSKETVWVELNDIVLVSQADERTEDPATNTDFGKSTSWHYSPLLVFTTGMLFPVAVATVVLMTNALTMQGIQDVLGCKAVRETTPIAGKTNSEHSRTSVSAFAIP